MKDRLCGHCFEASPLAALFCMHCGAKFGGVPFYNTGRLESVLRVLSGQNIPTKHERIEAISATVDAIKFLSEKQKQHPA